MYAQDENIVCHRQDCTLLGQMEPEGNLDVQEIAIREAGSPESHTLSIRTVKVFLQK